MYMHTYALCGYTRLLCTCQYAAIHVNQPSGISQAAAIAVNHTKGVKGFVGGDAHLVVMESTFFFR